MVGNKDLRLQGFADADAVIGSHLIRCPRCIEAHIGNGYVDIIIVADLRVAIVEPRITHEEDVAGARTEEEADAGHFVGQYIRTVRRADGRVIVAHEEFDRRPFQNDAFADAGQVDAVIRYFKALQLLAGHVGRIEFSIRRLEGCFDGIQIAMVLMHVRNESAVQALELPRIDDLRIEAQPVDGFGAGLLANAAVADGFRVEGRAAVLIDPVNTAFVGLQDPARAAAPPKADLALRYLIGRDFLIQEGTPFGITIFQPLLPVNVLIGRYIRTGNDTSAIVLRNSLFCHDEKPLSFM